MTSPHWKLKTPFGEFDETKWREVGAAWDNPDGSINIVLNAFVTLPHDRKYVLFRTEWTKPKTAKPKKSTDG